MKLVVFFSLLLISIFSFSQEKEILSNQVDKGKLPIPKEENQLFYLQRDPDANTIVYALNLENEKLNRSNPVLVYWIRYADTGKIEKLTFFQRRMAYGINQREVEPGIYELYIQAYKDLKIILAPHSKTGKYQALVKIEGKDIILDRIFARIIGGSLLKPNVEYYEISGRSVDNGKKVEYRFDL
jgi:hypothetical protein